MSARILVVGELNSYGSDPSMALYHLPRHASGGRLQRIMGLSDVEYLRVLDRVNLCTGQWSAREAKVRGFDLVVGTKYDVYVLLGAKVREACDGPLAFDTAKVTTSTLVGLPHPSGLSRAWNEPGAVQRARDLLGRVAPWVPWGSYAEASP